MSKVDYNVSCPYCRRQYRMKLDREEITVKKTRATCGRCGNSFELASRIAVPGVAAMAPPAPPPSSRRPTPRETPPPPPSAFPAEELDSMGRALHDAADQAHARAAGLPTPDTTSTAFVPAMSQAVPAPVKDAGSGEAIDLDATPAEITEAPAVPPPAPAPAARRTWLEEADPGIAHLKQEPSAALSALELLL